MLTSVVYALFTPRSSREHAAAVMIQREARVWIAKRRYIDQQRQRRALILMARGERKAVLMIEERWWARVRERKERATRQIQARSRGLLQRSRLRTEQRVAENLVEQEAAQKAAAKARMMSQCSAILEKRGRRIGLGSWVLTLWNERLVFVNEHALVYQHIRTNAEPVGAQRTVPFRTMRSVTATLAQQQLAVVTRDRSFCFQMGSDAEAERWATNLVTLAHDVGHKVHGFVVRRPPAPPEDESQSGSRHSLDTSRHSSDPGSPRGRAHRRRSSW